MLLAARIRKWNFLDEFHRQHERFESVMRIARLHELSSADAAKEMQHELLRKTRDEIREGFRTLDEGMQKRITDLEHRVLASIRDILPGIIREEMGKLLGEQRGDANT
jgi:benzoyl-CoA reductase/2-hydroxyglutaryl-CoA dehydratase subunit BcrC/BadD/HgdB